MGGDPFSLWRGTKMRCLIPRTTSTTSYRPPPMMTTPHSNTIPHSTTIPTPATGPAEVAPAGEWNRAPTRTTQGAGGPAQTRLASKGFAKQSKTKY